jgi:sulfate permease, SulP family
VGVLTLGLLVLWPRLTRRVPAPLVALVAGALAAAALAAFAGAEVATLADRFSWQAGGRSGTGIPPLPPTLALPWTPPRHGRRAARLSLDLLRALLPSALPSPSSGRSNRCSRRWWPTA